ACEMPASLSRFDLQFSTKLVEWRFQMIYVINGGNNWPGAIGFTARVETDSEADAMRIIREIMLEGSDGVVEELPGLESIVVYLNGKSNDLDIEPEDSL